MRIRNSRVFPYNLPLKAAWRSAAGNFAERSGWLLRLESEDGRTGWGDCAPLPGGGCGLEERYPELSCLDESEARGWLEQARLSPAAACAVDTALADLAAQRAGVPLARLLNPAAPMEVECNAVLGELDERAPERAERALSEGFVVLKFKVGLAPVNQELAMLRTLSAALPAGVVLRLDANRAWDMGNAAQFIDGLNGLPVESLEEPLQHPDLASLAALQGKTPVALALDESLPQLGAEQIVAATPVRRLILKPGVLGGLQASLELGRRAQAAGMTCVVTTSVESAAGTRAALHLAAALNNGLHHGLATSAWLARDAGIPPRIVGGKMRLEATPGLGFSPLKGVVS